MIEKKLHQDLSFLCALVGTPVLVVGMFLPLFTRRVTFGSFWKDVLILPVLRDDPSPVSFSLIDAIATLLRHGNRPGRVPWSVCFVCIPCLDALLALVRPVISDSTRHELDHRWTKIRCWGLLPVLLAGLAIVASKSASRGAAVTLNIGFYAIAAAVSIRSIPAAAAGIAAGRLWMRDRRCPPRVSPAHDDLFR